MISRFRILVGMALLLSLAIAVPVFAGGWAVITVDDLPVNATAGEPLTIGFTVLQHGKTPTSGLSPTIAFTLPKEKQFSVIAEEDDKGHYTASVTFLKEGEWEWTVNAFMEQPMPAISVAAAPVVTEPSQPAVQTEAIPYVLIVRVLTFGLALIGAFFAFRTKSRLTMGLTALCLMVGFASFIPGSAVPKVEAQDVPTAQPAVESSITQVELGRRLFIAKGCITCHVNNKVVSSQYMTIEMGAPNLSNFSASPEALFLRLKDPASVKADTQMPNLGLSEVEIEALIMFINSK